MEQEIISRPWVIKSSSKIFWGGSRKGWVYSPDEARRYLTQEQAEKAIKRAVKAGIWTGTGVTAEKI